MMNTRKAGGRLPHIIVYLLVAAVVAVCGLAICPILQAQPVDDDFSRAFHPRIGWFAYVIRFTYFHWSGRWAGVGLSAFVLPRLDPTRWYPLLLGGMHAAQLAALTLYWRLLFGARLRRRQLVGLAAGSYALCWALSPAPGEIYYWFSGGVEYYLSLSLSITLVAVLARGARRLGEGSGRGWIGVGLACLMAFAVAGMHEMLGAALCVVLGTALVAAGLGRRALLPWALACGFGAAGCLVCILAPGNAERAATFKNGHHLLHTVKGTGRLIVYQVIPWLLHPALWAGTLALLLTPPPGARRPAGLREANVPWRWLLPLATAAVVLIWLVGPYWAMGGSNGRALCATQQCLLLGWAASAVAWGVHGGWLRGLRGDRRRRLRQAAWVVLAAALLASANPRHVIRAELAGTVRTWSRQMALQRKQARQARAEGKKTAKVDGLTVALPTFFYSNGLGPDPADWRNQSFAGFYGLSSIRTSGAKRK